MSDEQRDALPDDLNAAEHTLPYEFPDNSRRRRPAVIYWVLAAVCLALWLVYGDGGVLVNQGMLWAAILLTAVGVFSWTSGWRMHVDEKQALVAAQQVWRGVRSRPTWRVLVYSTEDPPRRRGLVLVDAVDGTVSEHLIEDNLEQA